MKRKLIKLSAIYLIIFASLFSVNFKIFAKDYDLLANTDKISSVNVDLSDNYIISDMTLDELDKAHTKQLEEQGIDVLGGKSFSIKIFNDKTKGVDIVNVSWKIGNGPLGLESYVQGSAPIWVPLKRIQQTFTWKTAPSAKPNFKMGQTVAQVPTFKIHNTVTTGSKYKRGTKVYCYVKGDVDSVGEASGGGYSYSDVVNII